MPQVPIEQQMQMNRLMSRFGNLGISDGAMEPAREFLALYHSKIGHMPVAEKSGDRALTLDYFVGPKRLLIHFGDDGLINWESLLDEEKTDSGEGKDRLPSLVNWLIHR